MRIFGRKLWDGLQQFSFQHRIGILVGRSEDALLQVRNFGETTLTEVQERLGSIGLRLGMKVSSQQ